VFAGDRLFRLFGAHPQQPKKESPGPRRSVVLLAVRAVTESAESQSETTSTPSPWRGIELGSSYFGTLASGCLGLRGLSSAEPMTRLCLMNSHSEPARPKAPGRVSVEALIAAGSRRSPRWWQSARAVSRRGIARSQLEDVPPRHSVMGAAPLEWRLKLPGELRRWRSGTREHDAVRVEVELPVLGKVIIGTHGPSPEDCLGSFDA